MTTPSKAKGNAFERLIVGYLRQFWPNAARTLAGARDDRGDISGVPAVLELKNEKRTDLAGWAKEAQREAENAGSPRWAIVHKRRGVNDPALQWVTIPLYQYAELLMEGE